MAQKNNAALYDQVLYALAGIKPGSVIPNKRLLTSQSGDSEAVKNIIKIEDRQDALTKYVWLNCPKGITGQLIEQVCYHRGQGAFFKAAGTWHFLPYTLASKHNSGIDCYSRYKYITAVTMGSTDVNGKERKGKELFGGKAFKVLYEPLEDFMSESDEDCAIILHDFSVSLPRQINEPREKINDVLVEIESRLIPYAETAALNKTGVRAVRTNNNQEAEDIAGLNATLKYNALHQLPLAGVVGQTEMQELTEQNSASTTEFLELFQALENIRKGTHGTPTGGIMQKQSHMLEGEAKMNQASSIAQGDDGLYQRQFACVIFYSLTGHPMWCDIKNKANTDQSVSAVSGGEEQNDNTNE